MAKAPMDPITRARLGGEARARNLSKRKRKEGARKAAQARWAKVGAPAKEKPGE